MHQLQATRFGRDKVLAVLQGISLFPALAQAAPDAMDPLLANARFVLADPGEFIIRRGEFDSWFYFSLKGELAVSTGADGNAGKVVSYIRPGEMFGALAILREAERSASVQVSGNTRAILFGLDSAPFGDLNDCSQVSLTVKLLFLRFVVQRTEAHVLAYEKAVPGTDLSARLTQLPALSDAPGSSGELQYLYDRANALADLLSEWNLTLESLEDYEARHDVVQADLLDDLERLYFG